MRLPPLQLLLMPVWTVFVSLLPYEFVRFCFEVVADLTCLLDRKRRQAVAKNLQLLGIYRPERVRQTFRNAAWCLLDLLRSPMMRKSKIIDIAEPYGLDALDAALESGRSVILVSGHIGNYELAGIHMAARGYPMSAVVEPIGAGVTSVYERYRRHTGMEAITLNEPVKMLRALRTRRVLTLLGDRDISGTGIPCKFGLGRRPIPAGPARLALRTNAVAVLGYFVFDPQDRRPYRVVIEPLLDCAPSRDAEMDATTLTQRIADRLAARIRAYPDQWTTFHDEWLPGS